MGAGFWPALRAGAPPTIYEMACSLAGTVGAWRARTVISSDMTRSLRPVLPTRVLALILAWGLGAACHSATEAPATILALGTWGGDGAGLIVSDTTAHLHIGCTKGDFPRPPMLDAGGRFDVAGSYILRAYPLEIGPSLPARFTGTARGSHVIVTVVVNDTVAKQVVTLGPATVVRGREPRLGPCPICRTPEQMRASARRSGT